MFASTARLSSFNASSHTARNHAFIALVSVNGGMLDTDRGGHFVTMTAFFGEWISIAFVHTANRTLYTATLWCIAILGQIGPE